MINKFTSLFGVTLTEIGHSVIGCQHIGTDTGLGS